MKWLEWAGWDGVAGVVALVALVAAVVVTYFEVRNWWLTPRLRAYEATVLSDEDVRRGVTKLFFRFRVGGAVPIHEAAIYRVDEAGVILLGDEIPVLAAGDGFVERTTEVTSADQLIYFVVRWHEVNRYGARAKAMRVRTTGEEAQLEHWVAHKWPWRRQTDGRWVRRDLKQAKGERGMLRAEENNA